MVALERDKGVRICLNTIELYVFLLTTNRSLNPGDREISIDMGVVVVWATLGYFAGVLRLCLLHQGGEEGMVSDTRPWEVYDRCVSHYYDLVGLYNHNYRQRDDSRVMRALCESSFSSVYKFCRDDSTSTTSVGIVATTYIAYIIGSDPSMLDESGSKCWWE